MHRTFQLLFGTLLLILLGSAEARALLSQNHAGDEWRSTPKYRVMGYAEKAPGRFAFSSELKLQLAMGCDVRGEEIASGQADYCNGDPVNGLDPDGRMASKFAANIESDINTGLNDWHQAALDQSATWQGLMDPNTRGMTAETMLFSGERTASNFLFQSATSFSSMSGADPLGLNRMGLQLSNSAVNMGFDQIAQNNGFSYDSPAGHTAGAYSGAAIFGASLAFGGGEAKVVEAAPTGDFYSVAFETKLDPSVWGRSDTVHFNRANAALDAAIQDDAGFAATMEQLSPGVADRVSSVGGRDNPLNFTWHHAEEPGLMQLVPTVQHTPGSIFWRTLHPAPGAAGGYSIWAIPAGAPPR